MKGLQEVGIHWTGNPEELGEITIGLNDGSYANAYVGSPATVAEYLDDARFPGLSKQVAVLRSSLVGYVSAVEVMPGRRRRGVGSLLVRALMETLADLGARYAFLHAATSAGTSEGALAAFYDGLGFEEEACCEEDRWPVMSASLP